MLMYHQIRKTPPFERIQYIQSQILAALRDREKLSWFQTIAGVIQHS